MCCSQRENTDHYGAHTSTPVVMMIKLMLGDFLKIAIINKKIFFKEYCLSLFDPSSFRRALPTRSLWLAQCTRGLHMTHPSLHPWALCVGHHLHLSCWLLPPSFAGLQGTRLCGFCLPAPVSPCLYMLALQGSALSFAPGCYPAGTSCRLQGQVPVCRHAPLCLRSISPTFPPSLESSIPTPA